jgi:hypothetical protein
MMEKASHTHLVVLAFLLLLQTPSGWPRPMSSDLNCSISSKPHPEFQSANWSRWWIAVHAEVVRTTSKLNHHPFFLPHASEITHFIDAPIFVMNRADRPDRRKATKNLLAAVGFTNVSFPTTIMWHDINVRSLEASGKLHRGFKKIYADHAAARPGYLPYIANALSQLETMQKAVKQKLPLIGIFEDDLVAGSSLSNTNCRIRKALEELPPSADMLYLQVCYEPCRNMTAVHNRPSILRLRSPACTGAIFYTLQGAEKILKLALPVWDFIDRMLPDLIAEGSVEVSDLRACLP